MPSPAEERFDAMLQCPLRRNNYKTVKAGFSSHLMPLIMITFSLQSATCGRRIMKFPESHLRQKIGANQCILVPRDVLQIWCNVPLDIWRWFFPRCESNHRVGKGIKQSMLRSQTTWCYWWWMLAVSRVPPAAEERYQLVYTGAHGQWCTTGLMRCFTCH